jgi:hypothetical protein
MTLPDRPYLLRPDPRGGHVRVLTLTKESTFTFATTPSADGNGDSGRISKQHVSEALRCATVTEAQARITDAHDAWVALSERVNAARAKLDEAERDRRDAFLAALRGEA